jgi:CRP-like cAMP-binding protein
VRFTPEQYTGGNSVLDCLSEAERVRLLPGLRVALDEEASLLYQRNELIAAVAFPIDAIYSVVVELPDGDAFEVDLIGREGVAGAEISLGAPASARSVLCQAAGRVAHLPSDQFKAALTQSDPFLNAVRQSMRRQWFNSQQTVACNFAHTIVQRAARWILMTSEQLGRDEFSMRAEFLSIMLGVAPQLVREPLDVLAAVGSIRFADGRVTIISLQTLLDYACVCYAVQVRSAV